ncbi:MAG: hypothetical protein ACRCYY_10265 [Trueperaceae bacterium]
MRCLQSCYERLCLVDGITALFVACDHSSNIADINIKTPATFPEDIQESPMTLCKSDRFTFGWEITNGSNPRLSADPPQNIEPRLEKLSLEIKGEQQFTFRDSAMLSLKVGDAIQYSIYDREILAVPEAVCTGFPRALPGAYSGNLEQATPNVASLPHALYVKWSPYEERVEGPLSAKLKLQTSEKSTLLRCEGFDGEDRLVCEDPVDEKRLRLEGVITVEGYAGTY